MRGLDKWKEEIAIVIRREGIKSALYGLITLCVISLSSGAVRKVVTISEANFLWGALMAACVATLAYLKVRTRLSRFIVEAPRLDSDHEILEKEITYSYKSRQDFCYTKRVKLRALRNGLTQFLDKYSWTGRGSMRIKCDVDDQRYLELTRRSVWQLYAVNLNRTLNRGDEIETCLTWDLIDESGNAVPFVSATIEVPTEKLILKVRIDPSLGVRRVTCEECVGIASATALNTQLEDLDEDGRFEWVIHRPKLLRYYEIRWDIQEVAHGHQTDTATTRK